MDIEDIKKMKERIESEYNNLSEEEKKASTNKFILEKTCFEEKAARIIAFSMLPWLGFLLGSGAIIGILPTALIGPFFIGAPLLVGACANKLFEGVMKKHGIYTPIKRERDRIEEHARASICLEQVQNRKLALKRVYEEMDSNEKILENLSGKYDITPKNNNEINQIISEARLKHLESYALEKSRELDTISKKNVLSKLFWKIRGTLESAMDPIMFGMLAMVFSMMVYNLPLLTAKIAGVGAINIGVFGLLSPGIIAGSIVAGYGIQKNINRKKVFKKINDELSSNKLNEKLKINEYEDFSKDIEKGVSELAEVIKFREEERIKCKREEETPALFRDYKSELKVTKELLEDIKAHPEKYSETDARVRMGLVYTDEEWENMLKEGLERELPGEGPTLQLK